MACCMCVCMYLIFCFALCSSERTERLCYMCYDATDSAENPLVAPCDCRGDTRFVHMQCLQKWYSSSTSSKAHVVRISATGTTACKVCRKLIPERFNWYVLTCLYENLRCVGRHTRPRCVCQTVARHICSRACQTAHMSA